MCTLATGVAAVGGVMNYMAGKEQAEQQRHAQQVASQQERVRAGQEMRNVRLRQGQQRLALANEMEEGARRANLARATAVTAAGEAGIGGRAAELQQQDINVQNARYQHALQNQRSENDFASELQLENAQMRERANQQRINQPIKEPSLLEAGLGIITGVAQAQVQEANYEAAMGQPMTLANLTGLDPLRQSLGIGVGKAIVQDEQTYMANLNPSLNPQNVSTSAPTNFTAPDLSIPTRYSEPPPLDSGSGFLPPLPTA